jgi:FMN-dependent oxidoreductase (nitrilotriacetate monooxygenase family)
VSRKQVHLGAHFPGVNNTTVWSDPRSGSHIEVESFVRFAETAERGLFDFLFLAEGLRLREQQGRIFDLDVVGRPDTFTILDTLAAATTHLGLAGTINSTFNEPWEVARQFASLDHLSGGRAAWNIVTSSDAFTGENFRRGGFLPHGERYSRAAEFVELAQAFWDSWSDDALVVDRERGVFVRPGAVTEVRHDGPQFRVRGSGVLPRTPQGRPVLFQAGDSEQGREFAAGTADAIFTRHGTLVEGQEFTRDIRARAARQGRRPEDVKILPAATFVLGDTPEEAREHADLVRHQQVGPQTAIAFLEQVWNRDLSGYDPDGPLPDVDPDVSTQLAQGRANVAKDPRAVAQAYRDRAEAEGLSIRELIIAVTTRQQFVGTPAEVAREMDDYVQADACDGFILVPHLTPTGLDEFVDKVVPELQDRGVHRRAYTGTTLREHLDVPTPGRARAQAS